MKRGLSTRAGGAGSEVVLSMCAAQNKKRKEWDGGVYEEVGMKWGGGVGQLLFDTETVKHWLGDTLQGNQLH